MAGQRVAHARLQRMHARPAMGPFLRPLHASMDKAQSAFDASVAAVAKSSSDPEAQRRRQHEMVDFSTDFEASLKELARDTQPARTPPASRHVRGSHLHRAAR